MKQTILICDCCKLPVPAVRSVDLCEKHIKALGGYNRRERHAKSANKPKTGGGWNKADYDTINTKVLEFAGTRPFFTGVDVVEATKIKLHIVKSAIAQLLKSGDLEATGIGAGRKLSKVH